MLPFKVILGVLLLAVWGVEKTHASCALFRGGSDGLGSSLMTYLLMQGLSSGGGFQGAGRVINGGGGAGRIEGEHSPSQQGTAVVSTPIVQRSPSLLLPLLLAGGMGGFGGRGGMGGLGMLGLPLLLGMGGGFGGGLGGGLGGLGALAPLALLGMGGMGGGGLGAIAPLALLGMGRFRPFGQRRVVYATGNRKVYTDVRINPVATVPLTERVNGTLVWSPIASANHLRKHFGYGFLWGRRRAEFLKKVADDLRVHPKTLGQNGGKVWGHYPASSGENQTDIIRNRGTMAAGKFVRWISKVSSKKSGGGKTGLGRGAAA